MKILAIDPGSKDSGVVLLDVDRWALDWAEQVENRALLERLRGWPTPANDTRLVLEGLEHQGRMVGATVFETAEWIGWFRDAWEVFGRPPSHKIKRGAVKIELCGGHSYPDPKTGERRKVGPSEIRHALLERFPGNGGGETPQVGTKPDPGPLYGIKGDGGHKWSALAVAVAWWAIHRETRRGE